MTTKVTIKQEINKTAVDKNRQKLCFNCGKHWPHRGVKENVWLSENSVGGVAKKNILQSVVKPSKKLK